MLKVLVAERVRARLDSKKSLCYNPAVVVGGQQDQVLSEMAAPTCSSLQFPIRQVEPRLLHCAPRTVASLLPVFEQLMQEFNKTVIDQPNVLCLNGSERFNGARHAYSLECN
ncbi:hypothetical protein AAVH_42049 [Aphelenchoides avenae]|nr:hypothetical protein AAVH_42049 [Aphelenchus avenae]